MASMDYCVFENTYPDLKTCVRKLRRNEKLNQYEEPYRHYIYDLAKEYIEAYERYKPNDDESDE